MASAGSGSYRHCRFDSWHDKVTLPSWRVGSVAFASQPASTVSGKDAHSRNCSGAEKNSNSSFSSSFMLVGRGGVKSDRRGSPQSDGGSCVGDGLAGRLHRAGMFAVSCR